MALGRDVRRPWRSTPRGVARLDCARPRAVDPLAYCDPLSVTLGRMELTRRSFVRLIAVLPGVALLRALPADLPAAAPSRLPEVVSIIGSGFLGPSAFAGFIAATDARVFTSMSEWLRETQAPWAPPSFRRMRRGCVAGPLGFSSAARCCWGARCSASQRTGVDVARRLGSLPVGSRRRAP